jgi:hypothetical protein
MVTFGMRATMVIGLTLVGVSYGMKPPGFGGSYLVVR